MQIYRVKLHQIRCHRNETCGRTDMISALCLQSGVQNTHFILKTSQLYHFKAYGLDD